MPGFKFKNYKPFECDIIESDSIIVKKVLINFGTVFCTASNSLTNYFIPKVEGKPLIRSNEDNFLQNNTLIVEETRGTICLEITLNTFEDATIKKEWLDAFSLFSVADTRFKTYINKYVPPSIITRNITSSGLDNYKFSDPGTGLTKKVLVQIDPGTAKTINGIAKEKDDISKLPVGTASWTEANSAFYKLVDADDSGEVPLSGPQPYNARPLDICFDHNLFPLINISNIISEVIINFIPTTNTREAEEKLDKYNFILDNVKYIPIAWVDAGRIEQIVNFDYIYSFPYYFSTENLKTFKTTS